MYVLTKELKIIDSSESPHMMPPSDETFGDFETVVEAKLEAIRLLTQQADQLERQATAFRLRAGNTAIDIVSDEFDL